MNVPLLSRRQSQLCDCVTAMTVAAGYPPSTREIAARMGLSPTRAAQLLKSAAAKGAVAFTPNVARSWRVVSPVAPTKGPRRRIDNPSAKNGGDSR